jgi:Kelch motif
MKAFQVFRVNYFVACFAAISSYILLIPHNTIVSALPLPFNLLSSTDNVREHIRDGISKQQKRKLLRAYTGSVTIVRAFMPQNSTDSEIELGTYSNNSVINLQEFIRVGASPRNLSLYIHYSNEAFDVCNVQFSSINRNETVPPYSLNGQTGNSYNNALILSTAGSKSIRVKGYWNRSIVDDVTIVLNIVNTPLTPTNPVPIQAPVKSPVPTPVKLPVFVPSPIPVSPPAMINYTKGQWLVTNPNATYLQKRHESCFVMVGRRAVAIGGRGKKRPNIYNPITRKWTQGASAPSNIELHHMQCVAVDNKIWIVSAWTGGYPRETNAPFMYIYDPIADIWETRTPMPETRRRGSSAVIAVDHLIYVAFGNIGGHEMSNFAVSLNWFDVYNTRTDTWTVLSNAVFPRDHTGGAFVNGRICVGGGRDGGTIGWPLVAPTECYNITSKTWSIEDNVLAPRAGSSYGTTCDGKLIMAGGEVWDQGIASSQVDIFDGTTWQRIDDLNIARHSTGLAVDCVCNAMYIAAGAGTSGGSLELTSVETFFLGGKDVPCTM